MNVEQWRTLSDLLLQAFKETTTEYEYDPPLGAAFAVSIRELKKAERKEQESHDRSS